MNKQSLLFLLLTPLLVACTKYEPEIYTACDMVHKGDYIIKWETYPPLEGKVRVYESTCPDSFNLSVCRAEVDINDSYIRLASSTPNDRTFFKLVFNKKYSAVTSNRKMPMRTLFNFRDIGGYAANNGKQIRWGKIYRSSSLDRASFSDVNLLKQLGIKTVIDLRSDHDNFSFPGKFHASHIFNLPMRGNQPTVFYNEVLAGTKTKDEIMSYRRDIFDFLLLNNADYLQQVFDILLEERNYPLVISCAWGNERTALVVALVMAALDVEQEEIVWDYLLSNETMDFFSLVDRASLGFLSSDVQEAMTSFLGVNRETIAYSFDRIVQDYGSVNHYLEKELKLTNKKREKLKDLLLYQ